MQVLNVGTGSENESTLCHKNVHIFTWPGRDFLISHLVIMFCANNRYIKIYNIMYC